MQTIVNDDRNSSLEILIERLNDEQIKHYIYTRVIPQMEYYSNTSKKYKKQYKRWMVASIIISAVVPVVSALADGGVVMKVVIGGCGSAVTAINAYLAVENSKDLWYSNRQSRETLVSTLYYYLNDAGVFSNLDPQRKKDTLLIDLCEQEMAKETRNWVTIIKT